MADELIKLICIACPVGCALEVTHEGKTIVKLEGNQCKIGIEYANTELTDPRRMVTTTVKVKGGIHPLLPVFTTAPIPKNLIFNLMDELRKKEVQAPILLGQIVLENALGTGVNIAASRDLPEKFLYEKSIEFTNNKTP